MLPRVQVQFRSLKNDETKKNQPVVFERPVTVPQRNMEALSSLLLEQASTVVLIALLV